MKRLLFLLLLGSPVVLWAQQFVVANHGHPIFYKVLDKRNVAVCAPASSYASAYEGAIVIPNEVRYRRHRYQVTTIAAEAFARCTALESVVLPTTLEFVEYNAFQGCNGLHSVQLPMATVRIEEGAFARCEQLMRVEIANSDCEVHRDAFVGCGEALQMVCPTISVVDTQGLLWQEYYKASCYDQCKTYVRQMKDQREAEKARLAGDYRNDIRQSKEAEQQKWEIKHGQLPKDRPQLGPPPKRTTSLGDKGD